MIGFMKETTKHVLFWGGPLSNFEEVHFSLEGYKFSSSEQYFMWKKAKTFGDEEIAEKILKAKTPKEAKKLGRKVRGYDEGIRSEQKLWRMPAMLSSSLVLRLRNFFYLFPVRPLLKLALMIRYGGLV